MPEGNYDDEQQRMIAVNEALKSEKVRNEVMRDDKTRDTICHEMPDRWWDILKITVGDLGRILIRL